MHTPRSRFVRASHLLLFVLALVLAPSVGHAAPRSVPAARVRVVSSTATGVVLELRTPRPSFEPLPDGTVRLIVPGADANDDPGMPDVPLWNALLGVPVGATIRVDVEAGDPQRMPLPAPLAPVAQPAPRTTDDQQGTLVRIADPQAYASTAAYPPDQARVADDAMLRSQRVVRIALAPLQYVAAQQQIVWHEQLRVQVRWAASAPAARSASPDPFDAMLDAPLLNRNIAAQWRVPPRPTVQPQQAPASAAPQIKISVDRDGVYRLGYADLQAAGLAVDQVDPRLLQMTNQGRTVAIQVLGEGDGRFDAGDEIRFWGEQFRTRTVSDTIVLDGRVVNTDTQASALYSDATTYTDRNVYWLAVGTAPGTRMPVVDGTPSGTVPAPSFRTTARAEQSNVWWTWHFTSRDTWFWDRIQTSVPTTRTYPVTLRAPVTTTGTATVQGEIVARVHNPSVEPDHRVRVLLNGVLVTDATWDGRGRYRWRGEVPQTALRDGTNTLTIEVLPPNGVSDDLWVDWFDITYDRQPQAYNDQIVLDADAAPANEYTVRDFSVPDVAAYDISMPQRPQLIRNADVTPDGEHYQASFRRPSTAKRIAAVATPTLLQPAAITPYTPPKLLTGGADYIIVAPRELVAASQRLAQYRTAQGMRTVVVNFDDLVNMFNYGIVHPVAIKRFLAHAYANWQAPAPRYVVVVGDGQWNVKGFNPDRYGTAPNLMPPNLAWVDPWQGEVDSTNLLAAIVGDDLLPDVAIGRLPANNAAELDAMIDKIVTYEAAAPLQAWQRRLVFVADNQPDAAGNFAQLSDALIAEEVPGNMQAERVYLDEVCGAAANPPAPCPAAAAQLVDTLNNDGALLVNYAGHGSINRWAHEQAFTTKDIAALKNGDRLPVVLSMTCLDGYWFDPLVPSLAESLVRASERGAVATFSPTGLGVATGHDVLQRGFYQAVFRDDVRALGPATLAAKQALFATGQHDDLINTYTLFGDPALRLPVPSATYMPFAVGAQ